MKAVFIPGQRWLSEAEPDLGLGTVLSADARHVELVFPANGEVRTYAQGSAPLFRADFQIGDQLQDHTGRSIKVSEVLKEGDLLTYIGVTAEGDELRMPEADLSDHMRLNRPHDKLLAGRIDPDHWFGLRYQTWQRMGLEGRLPGFGLAGARISLIPHQLYIASEVASRHAPRVLLADEVGLGKTIEAGLILHRLLMLGRASRVLLVVPDPLIHQWLVEMLRRFNLRFSLFDKERFDAVGEGNPFVSEQRVLCSLEFLVSQPSVARAALEGEWDMLVVDEAHHLAWSEQETSLEYDLIEALAAEALGVLLLTATPEQLGRAGHFGRLRLLDPNRFHNYADFLEEEQEYEAVAAIAARLFDHQALETEQQEKLRILLGDEADFSDPDSLIEKLVDRHGTGRVLMRNTRAAIKGFPRRELHTYGLPQPESYARLSGDAASLLTPERVYAEPDWKSLDPRVNWLSDTLRSLQPEKILVICAHARTVIDLREYLTSREAIRTAVFHEQMEIVERDRAAAYFADPENGAQVLICSEIGSEGRNFQFAHHLVLFDLPLEPDLLEQRIGRLDRIGQTETIKIHVPYMQQDPSETLMRWYRDGLNAFAATCPAASAVFSQQRESLLTALADVSVADELIQQAAQLTAALNAELEQGRDRLLELNSHRPEVSAELVQAIHAQDQDSGLAHYLTHYLDSFGVEHEPGPGLSLVLHPGRHMLHENFPGLPEEGLTVTFDRQDALAHEDRAFITWEHPMVRGAMDMLTSDELGTAALVVASHADFKPGSFLLELLYVVECPAPAELEIRRFLPPTCLRLLLDMEARNHSAKYAHNDLQGECLTGNRKLAAAVTKALSKKLRGLLSQGEVIARGASDKLAENATDRMNQKLGDEIGRLRRLAEVNPSVRADELESLGLSQQLLREHLSLTGVRLDAVRVIVFN